MLVISGSNTPDSTCLAFIRCKNMFCCSICCYIWLWCPRELLRLLPIPHQSVGQMFPQGSYAIANNSDASRSCCQNQRYCLPLLLENLSRSKRKRCSSRLLQVMPSFVSTMMIQPWLLIYSLAFPHRSYCGPVCLLCVRWLLNICRRFVFVRSNNDSSIWFTDCNLLDTKPELTPISSKGISKLWFACVGEKKKNTHKVSGNIQF